MPVDSSDFQARKAVKKALRFCLMVAGQAGLGKTTFLATLFDEVKPPVVDEASDTLTFARTKEIKKYSVELEPESGVRLLVDAIDTPGYGDEIDPREQADTLLQYLEKTFDDVFEEEQRIRRNPKFEDHRIHALLYFVEPTSLGLKQFDIDVMKRLSPRVNIIPIIAKADGLTELELQVFKKKILEDVAKNNVKVYDFSGISEGSQELLDSLPFAVIGGSFTAEGGKKERKYPWGVVKADDPKHCDFTALVKVLLDIAREDLKEFTEDNLYEEYRTEKLMALKGLN